mmetsp:Transcript_66772/g.206753  ORF Transcript_66772/g.206753 Transcript_66772/m.206753 type:complete len:249 (-) Transcript_66772:251-997(-)
MYTKGTSWPWTKPASPMVASSSNRLSAPVLSMFPAVCSPFRSLGFDMMIPLRSIPNNPAISPFASRTFMLGRAMKSRTSTLLLSIAAAITGRAAWRTMRGSSPASAFSRRGPGAPNPGPSTSNQPGLSPLDSSSTHSPPCGPVQVRPVVRTLEPTFRPSLTTLPVAGSEPGFLKSVSCMTQYSEGTSWGAATTASGPASSPASGASPTSPGMHTWSSVSASVRVSSSVRALLAAFACAGTKTKSAGFA